MVLNSSSLNSNIKFQYKRRNNHHLFYEIKYKCFKKYCLFQGAKKTRREKIKISCREIKRYIEVNQQQQQQQQQEHLQQQKT